MNNDNEKNLIESELVYDTDEMSCIHLRIKKCRLNANMTQKQLADKLNVSVMTIRRFENGTRSPKGEMLIKLANVFNVDVLYLFMGEPKPKEKLEINKSSDEYMLEKYHKLNSIGKDKAIDYVTDLSEQEKYTKSDEPEE